VACSSVSKAPEALPEGGLTLLQQLRLALRLLRRLLLGLAVVLLSAPAVLLVAEEAVLLARGRSTSPPVLLAWSPGEASCPGSWRRTTPADAAAADGPLTLLVHGLDEPGGVWNDVAPALAQAGLALVRFDYPDDQPLLDSASALRRTLSLLAHEGVKEVRVAAHSMGGLVAWGALQRRADDAAPLPCVRTLVLVATPLWGSPWAHLRPFAEARDIVASLWTCSVPAPFADGAGQASLDLAPFSDALQTLHRQGPPQADRVVALAPALLAGASAAHPQRLASLLGDGVVPTAAMTAPWVDEVVPLRGWHRGVLAPLAPGKRPAALTPLLEALSRSGAQGREPALRRVDGASAAAASAGTVLRVRAKPHTPEVSAARQDPACGAPLQAGLCSSSGE